MNGLGSNVIITKDGKPDWEDFFLAKHFDLKKEAEQTKSLSKKNKTFTASQLKKKLR